MAFKIKEQQGKTFHVDIKDRNENLLASYELEALTYMRWNELGLMVIPDEAPKIKDPKNPSGKKIYDLKGQSKLDGQAEVKRNAIRLVVSLEGGEGIDWDGNEPDTLEEKADILMQIDSAVFIALLTALRNRAYGMEVTAEESTVRFQRLQNGANESVQSSENNGK